MQNDIVFSVYSALFGIAIDPIEMHPFAPRFTPKWGEVGVDRIARRW